MPGNPREFASQPTACRKTVASATKTSTGLYRSCAALANLSGTFDFISFQAVNFGFIARFGLDRLFEKTDKINGFGLL